MAKEENGFSVKELLRELQKEKYDVTRVPVYLAFSNELFEIESIDLYDDAVHIKPGRRVE